MTLEECREWKKRMDMPKMANTFGEISYLADQLAERLDDLRRNEEFPEEWIAQSVSDMIENLRIVDETAMSIENRFEEFDNEDEEVL